MANLKTLIVNGPARILGKIYGNLKGNVTVPYCTCGTAAGTAAKVVTCNGFELETGAKVTVKFTTTNTAANPTLNVNGTGAKAIYYRGAAIAAAHLAQNRTYEFIYNGTQFELIGDIDTTYENGDSSIYGNVTRNRVNVGWVESMILGADDEYSPVVGAGKAGSARL